MPAESNPEAISTYTDREAIEDGTLVAINARDRVSRTCWELLKEFAPADAQPPHCWPVTMLRWFRAKNTDDKAAALAEGLIGKYSTQANRVYKGNIGGGIFRVWAIIDAARHKFNTVLDETAPQAQRLTTAARVLWFVPNDNDGVTLMLPEDY